MTNDRHWGYTAKDARGRTHRGTVIVAATLPPDLCAPEPPRRFQIVLLTTLSIVREAPERTAICVPGVPRLHAVGEVPGPSLPRRIADLTLPPQRMAEYAAGRIVMGAEGIVTPGDIFALHTERPRLDRLALALVDAAAAEAVAPYTAIIRRGLKLPPGTDALAALDARLSTTDPAAKPPARAPAIVRLRAVLRRLRHDREPDLTLEALTDDLRFLMLFDASDDTIPADGMSTLLRDVIGDMPARATKPAGRAPIIPLRRPPEDP